MKKEIIIKGIHIDNQQPIICVPVIAVEKSKIIEEVSRLVANDVKMIEWRADYYEDLTNDDLLQETLNQLKELCRKVILLVTIRSKKQGGVSTLSEKEVLHVLEVIGKSHCADMVDVEFFEMSRPKRVIEQLQANGLVVISSHHDFAQTPKVNVMEMLLEQMADGGADIVKLAVMPQSVADVLALLKVTNDFYVAHEDVMIITMSMGRLGMVSRISGEVFGSCVTFGTYGKSSAPGQLPVDELQKALDFMHYNYMG